MKKLASICVLCTVCFLAKVLLIQTQTVSSFQISLSSLLCKLRRETNNHNHQQNKTMISSPPFILSILILSFLSNVQVQALDKSKQDELIDLRNENIARQKELLHEIGSHLRCYSISKCEYCPEFTDEHYYTNRNDHSKKLSEDEDDNKILGYYVTQFEACLDSRRFEVFECSVVQDEEEQQYRDGGVLKVDYESKPRLKYMKHCRYTEYDEQMNVWVMQVCVVCFFNVFREDVNYVTDFKMECCSFVLWFKGGMYHDRNICTKKCKIPKTKTCIVI